MIRPNHDHRRDDCRRYIAQIACPEVQAALLACSRASASANVVASSPNVRQSIHNGTDLALQGLIVAENLAIASSNTRSTAAENTMGTIPTATH